MCNYISEIHSTTVGFEVVLLIIGQVGKTGGGYLLLGGRLHPSLAASVGGARTVFVFENIVGQTFAYTVVSYTFQRVLAPR